MKNSNRSQVIFNYVFIIDVGRAKRVAIKFDDLKLYNSKLIKI